MSRSICLHCRASLQRAIISQNRRNLSVQRAYSSSQSSKDETLDIAAFLSKPTWSVSSLLSSESFPSEQEITPATLHRLLRLSALPQPQSAQEEAEMLQTLHTQLHFVRDIQSVNTEGVEPLQSIRDETKEGIEEATIGLKDLQHVLKEEELIGRNRRPRRRRGLPVTEKEVAGWDVTQTAEETVNVGRARFFVVRSGKIKKDEGEGRGNEEGRGNGEG